MQQRTALIVVLLLLVIIGGYVYMGKNTAMKEAEQPLPPATNPGKVVMPPTMEPKAVSAKEFTMTAFYDEKGVWYSLKDMSVKKGDHVRVTITNTKGMHDFTIDELGIKTELPLGVPIVIEFTADKVGDFVYYCSKMDHRAKGQWGTLHVTE